MSFLTLVCYPNDSYVHIDIIQSAAKRKDSLEEKWISVTSSTSVIAGQQVIRLLKEVNNSDVIGPKLDDSRLLRL